MHKFATALFLLLSCNLAFAEWTPAFTQNDKSAIYLNLSTLHRKDDTFKIWTLHDYPNAKFTDSKKKYFSSESLTEVNCTENQFRITTTILRVKRMGDGDAVESFTYPVRFADIPPDTFPAYLVETFCPK